MASGRRVLERLCVAVWPQAGAKRLPAASPRCPCHQPALVPARHATFLQGIAPYNPEALGCSDKLPPLLPPPNERRGRRGHFGDGREMRALVGGGEGGVHELPPELGCGVDLDEREGHRPADLR